MISTNFSSWKLITSSRNITSGKLASNRLVFVPLITVKLAFWNIMRNIWGSSMLDFCAKSNFPCLQFFQKVFMEELRIEIYWPLTTKKKQLFKVGSFYLIVFLLETKSYLNKFLVFNFRMECDLRGHFYIIPVGWFYLCSGIFELQKGPKKPNWNQWQNCQIKKTIHKIRTKRK